MSHFLQREAEEDSDADSDVIEEAEDVGTLSHGKRKDKSKKDGKPSKKRKIASDSEADSSEDEEEEDDDQTRKELADFVDDNPIEEPDESGSDDSSDDDKNDDDEELDDEDRDIIRENLGIEVRKKKKRVVIASDEEEDGDDESEKKKSKKKKHYDKDRQKIAEQIFTSDDDDDDRGEIDLSDLPPAAPKPYKPQKPTGPESRIPRLAHMEPHNEAGEEDEESSDADSFIVDDPDEGGGAMPSERAPKRSAHLDPQLREAQDIFGVDFDFDVLQKEFSDVEEEEEYEGGEGGLSTKSVKRVLDLFEPNELEKAYLTPFDEEVKIADLPERFQLRRIPVQHTDNDLELAEEAEWIFANAFVTNSISMQTSEGHESSGRPRDHEMCVPKIKKALQYIRTSHFEVPFIAFYRKEYVEPELTINDLWRIYHFDEKWTALKHRKDQLVRLMHRIQTYQYELYSGANVELTPDVRPLTEDDIQRVQMVTTVEEFEDVYDHFCLYYGHHVSAARRADKERAAVEAANEEGDENNENGQPAQTEPTFRYPVRYTPYLMCIRSNLAALAQRYGLTAAELGTNLAEKYTQNQVEECDMDPKELAREYICPRFSTEDDVLKGTRYLVASQIAADPTVRKVVRSAFLERAKLFVKPTKKGIREIDENHPCSSMKYLKGKPIKMLSGDQFLHLQAAEKDGLISMTIAIDDINDVRKPSNAIDHFSQSQAAHAAGFNRTFFQEIQHLYECDGFSTIAQAWNTQRNAALEMALKSFLYPQMERSLRSKLAEEAKEVIYKACQWKLYNLIKPAPYPSDGSYDQYGTGRSNLSVIGIYQAPVYGQIGYAALINSSGELLDSLALGASWSAGGRKNADSREVDAAALKQFIMDSKPTVLAVGVDSRDSMYFQKDMQALSFEIQQETGMPMPTPCETVDIEAASVYANSSQSNYEFREQPVGLKIAAGLARRVRDPLVEFVRLANPDNDVLCLKLHPLQSLLDQDKLLDYLTIEFVNRVNEVSVDLNEVIEHPHMIGMVQFVCGLGPRKASHILKQLKNRGMLLTRAELVTNFGMGPAVFLNCAGFVRIDVDAAEEWWEIHRSDDIEEDEESPVERLDATRVHPEAYEWARKMAIDALELDENTNQREAVRKIMENPDRLKDLDLDAFAAELERQNFGTKHTTLYDIRAELNQPYKDLRPSYKPVNQEDLFQMVTKETPETFHEGKLVQIVVSGFATRKPRREELDAADPLKCDVQGQVMYKCPFCYKIMQEISDVWKHFDEGACEGRKVGVKCRLDNGCNGYIHIKNISDKPVSDPEDRVQIGMTIWARITKIDTGRFQVDLTSRSSDLLDKSCKYHKKDSFWDSQAESEDKQTHGTAEQSAAVEDSSKKQVYMKRVIAHPSFRNITFTECEQLLAEWPAGEAVVRPSSQGPDHLTLTWKVAEGIYQHVDILERDKQNMFSIGKKLEIRGEEFEDLDEILARYVQPMANHVRELMTYKYYRESEGGKITVLDQWLFDDKSRQPASIPYYLSAAKEYPGKFLLSYMPRNRPRHELVTVNPDGYRFRTRQFNTLGQMIKWFKEHFDDPLPQTMSAPAPSRSNTTTASTYGSSSGAYGQSRSTYSGFSGNGHSQYGSSRSGGSSSAQYSTPGQTSQQPLSSMVSSMSFSQPPPPQHYQNYSDNRSNGSSAGGSGNSFVKPTAPRVPTSIPRYN